MRKITIDPITRLEGHGKIEIFLNDEGNCERAYLQIPELRGFEKFSEGRPAEEMPRITTMICGVCPTAHHMAATKALTELLKPAQLGDLEVSPFTIPFIIEKYFYLSMSLKPGYRVYRYLSHSVLLFHPLSFKQ